MEGRKTMPRQPIIKTPRQRRLLQALLDNADVSVKDVGPLIGALNPRQIVHELRQQGFHGIIQTRRFSVIDQDGKKCRPGSYYIPLELKSWMADELKKISRLESFNPQGSPKKNKQTHDTGGA
jgi:hypothetical protein